MSSSAKITTPLAADGGKVPQYNAGTDTWDLGPAPLPAIGFASTYWYTSASGATDSTLAITLNRLYFTPLRVNRQTTFDRIGADITTVGSAGSVLRLGIYNNTNGLPSTVVLDAGTIDGTSATSQAITISQAVAPGVYWLACVAQVAACTVRTRTGTDPAMPLTAQGAGNVIAIAIDSVTGALPTYSGTAISSTHAPKLYVRVA